jgi:tetratricopeptide (TPR) repeat protein
VDYHHGYIAWCIDKGKKKEAEIYIEKAEAHLAYLESEDYRLSDIFAYKAAFIGFEIGLARHKAPFIGPKSIEFAEKSIQLNKKNAMGYVQLGNIEYYTPKFAGGSKEIAVQHYQHALRIMESQKDRIVNNWNYLNLLATLINAYVELGDLDKAANYCNKTRKIEPNFDWVNNTLCPNIQKK